MMKIWETIKWSLNERTTIRTIQKRAGITFEVCGPHSWSVWTPRLEEGSEWHASRQRLRLWCAMHRGLPKNAGGAICWRLRIQRNSTVKHLSLEMPDIDAIPYPHVSELCHSLGAAIFWWELVTSDGGGSRWYLGRHGSWVSPASAGAACASGAAGAAGVAGAWDDVLGPLKREAILKSARMETLPDRVLNERELPCCRL